MYLSFIDNLIKCTGRRFLRFTPSDPFPKSALGSLNASERSDIQNQINPPGDTYSERSRIEQRAVKPWKVMTSIFSFRPFFPTAASAPAEVLVAGHSDPRGR